MQKKKYFWVAVYIDKENIVLEIEKRVLGQNGIEFQEKMIENIKYIAYTVRIILILN